MAKLDGPLLSLGARGQIAKAMVTSNWRGISYARKYVIPTNPKTAAQTTTRNTFSSLDDQFKRMLTNAQAPFVAAAKGRPYTARNSFLQHNIPALRGDSDLTDYIASPGVNGGLPGLNWTAAGGTSSGEIDVSLDFGEGPIDWEATDVIFTALPDRDPVNLMTTFVDETKEAGPGATWTPPHTVSFTFTGLSAGSDYAVSGFLVWTRADGTIAYGPSNTSIVTATA